MTYQSTPRSFDPAYLALVHSRTALVRLRDEHAARGNQTVVFKLDKAIHLKDSQ